VTSDQAALAVISALRTKDAAARLRHLREQRGLTLRALAERAEVNPGLLSMIERGQRQAPRHVAVALARELGIELGEVFELSLQAQAEHRRNLAINEIEREFATR